MTQQAVAEAVEVVTAPGVDDVLGDGAAVAPRAWPTREWTAPAPRVPLSPDERQRRREAVIHDLETARRRRRRPTLPLA